MASPKGEYTPKNGPLAGTTYSSYYRYQVARSQEVYGYKSYSEERSARATSQNEYLYEVVSRTMREHGYSRNAINERYLKMRQESGGKHPTRAVVVRQLRQQGVIDEGEEPIWYPGE